MRAKHQGKARKCTSDIFSPAQRTFGSTPFDYNENTFEILDPTNFNKARVREFGQNRMVHNAIWFKALKVLPGQKVYDFDKAKNTSTVVCEHGSQGYNLRGITIQQCVDECAETWM